MEKQDGRKGSSILAVAHRLVSETIMRRLYNLLTVLLTPVLLGGLLWLSIQQPGYRKGLGQRLGRTLPQPRPCANGRIWIHAVSVGETLAIAPLIETLLTRRPDLALLVTSTTPTGSEQVHRLFGDRVDQAWLPLDSPYAVARSLDHWQPAVVVLVETELWPELISQCKRRGIKTLLLNGRLSARSLRRYARLGSLMRSGVAAMDHICCQHRSDARRFRTLGASAAQVSVAGNLKFDIPVDAFKSRRDQLAVELKTRFSGRPIFLAASTHTGEDAQIIAAFKMLRQELPNSALWLAPRHPPRSGEILELLHEAGLPVITRSSGDRIDDETEVLLIDTLGELPAFMGLASVVFVGGSLIPHGGHNPLEALVFGLPVIAGDHTTNFADLYRQMDKNKLLTRVGSSRELAKAVVHYLGPTPRAHFAQEGPRFIDAQRGALAHQYEQLEKYCAPETDTSPTP